MGHDCVLHQASGGVRIGRVTDHHAFPGVEGNLRAGDFQAIGNVNNADAVVMDRQVLFPYAVDSLRLMDLYPLDQFIEHPGRELFCAGVLPHRGDEHICGNGIAL